MKSLYKTKNIYDYDVYFNLKTPMIFAVAATSAEQAKLTALRELESMDKSELIDRFMSVLEIDPEFIIDSVDCIEETTYCFNDEEKKELIRLEKEENPKYKKEE